MTISSNADAMIPVKSPLALVGTFMGILQKRFAPTQGLDWAFQDGGNTIPSDDDGRNQSELHIEAGRNPDSEDFGRRPAIYVTRGPISYSQPVIDDFVDQNSKIAKKLYYAIAQTNITFSIEAELPGEAEIIADIVLATMMMGSNQIEATFCFRKLGPFALSSRGSLRQDVDITQINVNMGLSYDVRWSTMELGPLLMELVVKARESSYTNSSDFFTEIYQHSLRDSPNSTT